MENIINFFIIICETVQFRTLNDDKKFIIQSFVLKFSLKVANIYMKRINNSKNILQQ